MFGVFYPSPPLAPPPLGWRFVDRFPLNSKVTRSQQTDKMNYAMSAVVGLIFPEHRHRPIGEEEPEENEAPGAAEAGGEGKEVAKEEEEEDEERVAEGKDADPLSEPFSLRGASLDEIDPGLVGRYPRGWLPGS